MGKVVHVRDDESVEVHFIDPESHIWIFPDGDKFIFDVDDVYILTPKAYKRRIVSPKISLWQRIFNY